MPTRSGICGKILKGASTVVEVRNWSFTMTAAVPTYVSSSTSSHQKTQDGPRSGALSFEVFYDTSNKYDAMFRLGDLVTLFAHVDGTDKYEITCRITSLEHTCNVEGGDIQTVAVEAVTDGTWKYTTGVTSPAVVC